MALDTVDVTVNITDDEDATVSGKSETLNLTEPDSGSTTSTYTLTLSAVPTSDVTVSMAVEAVTPAQVSGQAWTDPDITVTSSVTLGSTNWMTGAEVTVTLPTDTDAEDDVARIVHTVTQSGGSMEFNGYALGNTTVNISDPETPVVEFKLSTESASDWSTAPDLTIAEGEGLTLDVRLSHQPRNNVTVTASIVPQSLGQRIGPSTGREFLPADWTPMQSQQFNLGNSDDSNSYPEEYSVDFSVSGYGSGTVADLDLTVTENDPVGASVDPDPPRDHD